MEIFVCLFLIVEKKMRTRKDMDYIYTDGDREILIVVTQKKTRSELIEQYVRCRKDKHMTQADLAKRAGMPRPNIARFESGTYNPSLEMMVRIAAALGMQLEISLKEKKED